MRLTKRQLKRIIQEEKRKLLRESVNSPTSVDQAIEWLYGEPGRMNDPRAHSQHFSVIEKAFPQEAAALRAGTVPDSAKDPGSPFRVVWDYIASAIADSESEYAWGAFSSWWDGRPEDAFDEYLD